MNEPTHSCRLYLAIPHDADDLTIAAFEKALGAGDVACALLRAGDDGKADLKTAERLCAMTLDTDTVLLVESDVAAAEQAGADGVHIAGDEAAYEAARTALGQDAIVGMASAPERHTALMLAEKGADYIAFGGGETNDEDRNEMIAWWSEIVEVPVVAWGAHDADDAAALARLGADFVAVEESVWNRGGDPAAATAALNRALEQERSAA